MFLNNSFSDIHRENARYIKNILKKSGKNVYDYDYIREYVFGILKYENYIKCILDALSEDNEDISNRALQLHNVDQEKLVRDFYDKYVLDSNLLKLRLLSLKYGY